MARKNNTRPLNRDARDPHGRLLEALMAAAGDDAEILSSSSRPWASATFQGAQHLIALRFQGIDPHKPCAAMAEAAPEQEFAIPGHIVADVSVDGQDHGRSEAGAPYAILRLSALTIEDW